MVGLSLPEKDARSRRSSGRTSATSVTFTPVAVATSSSSSSTTSSNPAAGGATPVKASGSAVEYDKDLDLGMEEDGNYNDGQDDGFSTCAFCDNVPAYTDPGTGPLLLPCLHMVCSYACLKMAPLDSNGVYSCPLCHKMYVKTDLEQHVLLMGKLRLEATATTKAKPKCDTCTRNSDAELWCKACEKMMCERCVEHHKFAKDSHQHQYIDVKRGEDLQRGVGSGPQDLDEEEDDGSKCEQHNLTLEHYCEDCSAICCGTCLRPTHNGHNIKTIQEKATVYRKQLSGEKAEILKCLKAAKKVKAELIKKIPRIFQEHKLALVKLGKERLFRLLQMLMRQELSIRKNIAKCTVYKGKELNMRRAVTEAYISQASQYIRFTTQLQEANDQMLYKSNKIILQNQHDSLFELAGDFNTPEAFNKFSESKMEFKMTSLPSPEAIMRRINFYMGSLFTIFYNDTPANVPKSNAAKRTAVTSTKKASYPTSKLATTRGSKSLPQKTNSLDKLKHTTQKQVVLAATEKLVNNLSDANVSKKTETPKKVTSIAITTSTLPEQCLPKVQGDPVSVSAPTNAKQEVAVLRKSPVAHPGKKETTVEIAKVNSTGVVSTENPIVAVLSSAKVVESSPVGPEIQKSVSKVEPVTPSTPVLPSSSTVKVKAPKSSPVEAPESSPVKTPESSPADGMDSDDNFEPTQPTPKRRKRGRARLGRSRNSGNRRSRPRKTTPARVARAAPGPSPVSASRAPSTTPIKKSERIAKKIDEKRAETPSPSPSVFEPVRTRSRSRSASLQGSDSESKDDHLNSTVPSSFLVRESNTLKNASGTSRPKRAASVSNATMKPPPPPKRGKVKSVKIERPDSRRSPSVDESSSECDYSKPPILTPETPTSSATADTLNLSNVSSISTSSSAGRGGGGRRRKAPRKDQKRVIQPSGVGVGNIQGFSLPPLEAGQMKISFEDHNEDYCAVCRDGGTEVLICCDGCPKVFHTNCHLPVVAGIPEEDWQCNICKKAPKLLEEWKSFDKVETALCNAEPPVKSGNRKVDLYKIQKCGLTKKEFILACKLLCTLYQFNESMVVSVSFEECFQQSNRSDKAVHLNMIRLQLTQGNPSPIDSIEVLITLIRKMFWQGHELFKDLPAYVKALEVLETNFNTLLPEYFPNMVHITYPPAPAVLERAE